MMKYRDKRSIMIFGLWMGFGVVLFARGRFCPAVGPAPEPVVVQVPAEPRVVVQVPAEPPVVAPAMPAVSERSAVEPPYYYLPSEETFRSTLRSCSGDACFTATPAGAGVDARIALLAPPSDVSAALWKWYERLLSSSKKPKIEWVKTGHAPPYGYGKNHGYTRIVRLALPLLSSVEASVNVTSLASSVLRQHVRCRVGKG